MQPAQLGARASCTARTFAVHQTRRKVRLRQLEAPLSQTKETIPLFLLFNRPQYQTILRQKEIIQSLALNAYFKDWKIKLFLFYR